MTEKQENIITKIKKWHPLTEMPNAERPTARDIAKPDAKSKKSGPLQLLNPLLAGISEVLKKLLWDILVYLYSSVSARIKRLNVSARAFEKAKHEGQEKGFFIESSAGQTVYLIPTKKAFEAFNMPFPYERSVSTEHSFYVGLGCFLLEKDPCFKSVEAEVKRGTSGATCDIVTTAHNGTRQAYEVTLNTTNILANASKYENTDFQKIIFLCRDYRLKEAVKACCREGGLNPGLLVKLEYMHFSQLLRRQRKLSLY